MIYRLLYISRSAVPENEADRIVASIVEVSQARNAREGLTGALMFTGEDFAQVLEGDMVAVLRLMADIARDQRHADVEIIEQGHVPVRYFGDWTMGYWGRSAFVSRLINDMRPSSGVRRVQSRDSGLIQFMAEWARKHSA